jgi:hypothetical protein
MSTLLLVIALALTIVHAFKSDRCPLWIPLLIVICAWLLPAVLPGVR